MQRNHCIEFTSLVAVFVLVFATDALAAVHKIVIGHPACLSGKHAKAGEQAVGGIQAIVDWVNTKYGGVTVEGKKVPLEYVYYDSESSKDAVTSLITRLITADKVHAIMAPYSSGLTLRGAPVAESRKATMTASSGTARTSLASSDSSLAIWFINMPRQTGSLDPK